MYNGQTHNAQRPNRHARSNGHVSAAAIPQSAAQHDNPPGSVYSLVKGSFDFVFALVLLALTTPLMLVLAAIVKLTSRGPAFYAQTRLGRHGRPYTLYKLRTMTCDAERAGAQWAMPGDPRVTGFGAFLRKTHLDELPQLWNVLRGDMSIVGPRPERPEFVPCLAQAIPHYRDRLAVKPGVTGLAQVRLPGDTDLDSVRRKLAYDLYYIRHMGLWLDIRLIMCTVLKMIGVPFRVLARIFLLPSRPAVAGQSADETPSSDEVPVLSSPAVAPGSSPVLFSPELALEAAEHA